jgi:hypothetical protein
MLGARKAGTSVGSWVPSVISAASGIGGGWLGARTAQQGQKQQRREERADRRLSEQKIAMADVLSAGKDFVYWMKATIPLYAPDEPIAVRVPDLAREQIPDRLAATRRFSLAITVARFNTDDEDVEDVLLDLAAQVDNMSPVMKDLGVAMEKSVTPNGLHLVGTLSKDVRELVQGVETRLRDLEIATINRLAPDSTSKAIRSK